MNRKKLIRLFQEGMSYPAGEHHLWVSRCFEITVRSDEVVVLNEYERFDARPGKTAPTKKVSNSKDREGMFHVGRSIIHKDGRVVEETGSGWKSGENA